LSDTHEYEEVVVRALRSVAEGPWTAPDLQAVREAMAGDWCSSHAPECQSADVLMWLDSLSDDEKEELLFHANTFWNEARDPWALG
jgi:hypothetical protein